MRLTEAQRKQYERDGYVLLPSLLSEAEVTQLRDEVARLSRLDGEGIFRESDCGPVKLMARVHEPDGITASPPFRTLSQSPRVLGIAQDVLGNDALYIHHTKVNFKEAVHGSVWPWHQDYGQWRLDGIQAPDMTTVMIMLDDASEIGGCLYFLPGSHMLGRKEPYWNDTTGYNLHALPAEDVTAALAELGEPVAVAGKAGDAAVFHCNLFHASGHNLSPKSRCQAYFCFNTVANRPHNVPEPRPDYIRSTNWTPLALGPDEPLRAMESA